MGIAHPIEIRLSQTHGPYFLLPLSEAEEISAIIDRSGIEYARNVEGELRIVPPGMCAYTFGDADRAAVARILQDASVAVSLAEADPPVYPPPVDSVLELHDTGRYWETHVSDWELLTPDLSAEHGRDLLRMALDQDLTMGCPRSFLTDVRWRAWLALATLKEEAALDPLGRIFDLLDSEDEDQEYSSGELTLLFGAFGVLALPLLEERLRDSARRDMVRIEAIDALQKIGETASARPAVVALIQSVLKDFPVNSPGLNGFLIAALLDLRAEESLDLIEAAFAADRVDEMICGDWEDAQIEFGLISRRTQPRRPNKLTEIREKLLEALGLADQEDEEFDRGLPPQPSKVGRNDPCPCGSGKKFKKCCGAAR